jgi:hypothetical protein
MPQMQLGSHFFIINLTANPRRSAGLVESLACTAYGLSPMFRTAQEELIRFSTLQLSNESASKDPIATGQNRGRYDVPGQILQREGRGRVA